MGKLNNIIIFLFLIVLLFSEEKVSIDKVNEKTLPILSSSNKENVLNRDIKNISFFSIGDFIKLLFFLLLFFSCVLFLKKITIRYKEIKNSKNFGFIKEFLNYEIDNKNSIRIISILNTIYIFLISGSSSILLKEIKNEEEVAKLKFELSKKPSIASSESFKSILEKMLKNKNFSSNENSKVEYKDLEKDIESSFKDKQERLKKF